LTITGLVPPADVSRRLAAASVLVLPNTASAISERYTSPLKLFEYLMLGRPIIASDLASIREVLDDGRTALLVPPGDAAALAAAIVRVRDDATLAAGLAANAAVLSAQYTWAARAGRLEAAIDAARTA
jgi:glycosyltransferase involved in cell wall biosynthesis